jgi:hypothetical protein
MKARNSMKVLQLVIERTIDKFKESDATIIGISHIPYMYELPPNVGRFLLKHASWFRARENYKLALDKYIRDRNGYIISLWKLYLDKDGLTTIADYISILPYEIVLMIQAYTVYKPHPTAVPEYQEYLDKTQDMYKHHSHKLADPQIISGWLGVQVSKGVGNVINTTTNDICSFLDINPSDLYAGFAKTFDKIKKRL